MGMFEFKFMAGKKSYQKTMYRCGFVKSPKFVKRKTNLVTG